MKLAIWIILAAFLFAAFLTAPAQAGNHTVPTGTCPAGFALHHIMEHMDHHDHHIGLEFDLNQDGYICVKHLAGGLHVHIDNVLP
jgi:hypothetical protein